METSTGGQVYHIYIPDQMQGQQAACRALYDVNQQGEIVPALTLDAKADGMLDQAEFAKMEVREMTQQRESKQLRP